MRGLYVHNYERKAAIRPRIRPATADRRRVNIRRTFRATLCDEAVRGPRI